MLVRVLGTVEVRSSSEQAWIQPPPQQRIVLALLVAQLGYQCPAERLVHALWGDRASAHACRLVQGLVARLRRVLEPGDGHDQRLVTVVDGWRLDLGPELVDAAHFEALVRDGCQLAERGEHRPARARLAEALGLWRGRPFAELADHNLLAGSTARLEEQRLEAQYILLKLRLADGEYSQTVGQLRALVTEYPLQERLWGLLLVALYGSGRSADAFAAYEELRGRLDRELGAVPEPALRKLHLAILHQKPVAGLLPPGDLLPERAGYRPTTPHQGVRLPWTCRRDLPLVGRQAPWAVLEQALEEAHQGRLQLVLVCGEPGIGKTRLVSEFAEQANHTTAVALVGSCAMPGVPYQPFIEALRAHVTATPDEWLPVRLGRYAGELVRLVPELAERIEQRATHVPTAPQLEQHRLFDAVAGWLSAASAQTPLVVVVDDLHAAQRPTLLVLRHLVDTAHQARLLLVATFRDTPHDRSSELDETVATLVRRPHVTELRLTGLDPPAVADLLASHHHDFSDPAGWAEAIHQATAGNPLFVEELLTTLDAHRPPDPDHILDHLAAPQSVRQLLETRLRRLSPATVQLLQQAAVAGETFGFAEVTQAAGLTPDEALDALDEAGAAGLVTATGAGIGTEAADDCRFIHAIMRTALLDSTSCVRQAWMHARLAATLERRHAEDPLRVASRLAHHYTAAGSAADPAKTLTYVIAAGDAAMAQLAYDKAIGHYQHALTLLDPEYHERRCELLIRLGQAQDRCGHADRYPTLLTATRLAIDLADPDRIARAAVAGSRGFFSQIGGVDEDRVRLLHDALETVSDEHPGPRALLLALLASELVFSRDLTHRRQLSDEALRLARQQDDLWVLARVLAQRELTIQHPATLGERLDETAELVELAQRLDDPAVQTFAHTWRFLAALEAGDRPRADAAVDEACRLAEEFDHPVVRAYVSCIATTRELAWGDLDRAHQIATQLSIMGRNAEIADADVPSQTVQVFLYHERGQLADYLPVLEQVMEVYGEMSAWQASASLIWWMTGDHARALAVLDRYAADDFTTVPHDLLWSTTLCLFARVAALAGRHDTARALRTLLTPYQDRLAVVQGSPLGAVAHYLGLLATTLEDWDSARAYLDRAADIHRRIGAHRWYNHTRLAQARLLLGRGRSGDRAEAKRILHDTATRARRHGQSVLCHEAEDLGRTI